MLRAKESGYKFLNSKFPLLSEIVLNFLDESLRLVRFNVAPRRSLLLVRSSNFPLIPWAFVVEHSIIKATINTLILSIYKSYVHWTMKLFQTFEIFTKNAEIIDSHHTINLICKIYPNWF